MTDTPDPAAIEASPIVARILEAARRFDALPKAEQDNLNSQIAWLGRAVAAACLGMHASGWRPIQTAPKDAWIFVYAAPYFDLEGFVCVCHWHPEGGFCVDELREPIAWMPIIYPDPPLTENFE